MLGFFSVDLTIDDQGKPWLIEINGAKSGFDGFLMAYSDEAIIDRIDAAFRKHVGGRDVYMVTRLVNFGELPPGYLDKLPRDCLLLRSMMNVLQMLPEGTVGIGWARTRADRPPSTLGAGSSLVALSAKYPRFREVALNVADPGYVIPLDHFRERAEAGAVSLRAAAPEAVNATRIHDGDVMWLRCPSLGFAAPLPDFAQKVNQEYPYDAIADNKLFTYQALDPHMGEHIPRSVPVGNRCTGSRSVREFLSQACDDIFVRKPLASSQARGVEFLNRREVEDYAARLERLEAADSTAGGRLPLELRGVAEFIEQNALKYDVTLLSELKLSKPVRSSRSGREHHGCMRALAMVSSRPDGGVDVAYLGAYWRLARVPADGDGLLWERFVGSQSQGAHCEAVSSEDESTAREFVDTALKAYCRAAERYPADREGFEAWERDYWVRRYRGQAPMFASGAGWPLFQQELDSARAYGERLKADAEALGYRRTPTTFLKAYNASLVKDKPKSRLRVDVNEQASRLGLPYLVKDAERIVVG